MTYDTLPLLSLARHHHQGRIAIDAITVFWEKEGIYVEVMRTERALHATEIARALNVRAYDAIIVVGGDGCAGAKPALFVCVFVFRVFASRKQSVWFVSMLCVSYAARLTKWSRVCCHDRQTPDSFLHSGIHIIYPSVLVSFGSSVCVDVVVCVCVCVGCFSCVVPV